MLASEILWITLLRELMMDEEKVAKILYAIVKKEKKKTHKEPPQRGAFTPTDEYLTKFGIGKVPLAKPVTTEEKANWELFWQNKGRTGVDT